MHCSQFILVVFQLIIIIIIIFIINQSAVTYLLDVYRVYGVTDGLAGLVFNKKCLLKKNLT